MEQVFIRLQTEFGKRDIDINDSTTEERKAYYNCLSKGQVVSILEKFVENKLTEENKK